MAMKRVAGMFLSSGLVLAAACGGDTVVEPEIAMNLPTSSVSDVTEAEWKALASRRIFFGHQSVGRDIMTGVQRVLERHPEIALAVVQSDDPAAVEGPAFIEGRIGTNTRPETKTAAFMNALENGFGREHGALAMYKFCYVDVNPDTDPEQLFSEYAAAIEDARDRFPGLTFVHFTMPLKTADSGWKEQLGTRLGMATPTRMNAIRNRYNDLLRERYAATDPVFDIALLESTRADGSRSFTRYRGQAVYMLAPEWTTDGGHLNAEAQYRVAERLLVFLARLGAGREIEVADITGSAR